MTPEPAHPVGGIRRTLALGAILTALVYVALCALLYLSQRSFIYYPSGRSVDTPAITLDRDDARVLISTNGIAGERTVLYFGGNAEDVSQAVGLLGRAFPDTAIYAMHYRGYGGSSGTPSEHALVGDALALFDEVASRHPGVTVIGRSLGSGIAVQLAASRPVERLVLVTPYNSLLELAAERFCLFPVRLLLRDKYESWRHAGHLRIPTTVIVAGRDQVIPNDSSRRLAEAFPPGTVTFVTLPDADHNNLSNLPEYLAALTGRHEPGNHR